jgi:Uma2 family endonuclease
MNALMIRVCSCGSWTFLDLAALYLYTLGMTKTALLKKDCVEGGRFTYADYKSWELAQGERYELIYGEAYAMSAPSAYHQLILGELFKQIAVYLTGKSCKVYPAPYDVRLFYQEDEEDDTVVQPDITIVCDKNKRGKEGCRGGPDFVAEILSPTNTAGEMRRKFALYREAGVREYWELDPESKTVHTYYFKDAVILSHFYRSSDTVRLAIFQDLEIALEPVFAE